MTKHEDGATLNGVALSELLAGVFALSDRRLWLCKNTPNCPKCGEHWQMQLVDWAATPAYWKCRKCKHKFRFEPANSVLTGAAKDTTGNGTA